MDVARSSLSNDSTIPACVVVNIDDAHISSSVNTALDLLVVSGKVRGVESTAKLIVHQELPADCETKDVQAVIVHEVFHLGNAIISWVDNVGRYAVSGSVATEVEATMSNQISGSALLYAISLRDVDAGVADSASNGRTSCCC